MKTAMKSLGHYLPSIPTHTYSLETATIKSSDQHCSPLIASPCFLPPSSQTQQSACSTLTRVCDACPSMYSILKTPNSWLENTEHRRSGFPYFKTAIRQLRNTIENIALEFQMIIHELLGIYFDHRSQEKSFLQFGILRQ